MKIVKEPICGIEDLSQLPKHCCMVQGILFCHDGRRDKCTLHKKTIVNSQEVSLCAFLEKN